jgi:hypothetical protein
MTCPCCEELEKEIELCHEALNRRGMDLRIVVAGEALEAAAVAFGESCGDAFRAQELLQVAVDYAATVKAVNEGATGAGEEGGT